MSKVLVETSARHLHVTQEHLEILFGAGAQLTVKKMLSQPGQFASEQKVTVVGPKSSMNMSILGPVRKDTQVEVSLTDARSLGLSAPIRESGDIAGSAPCKLVGPCGRNNALGDFNLSAGAYQLAGRLKSPRALLRPSAISTPLPKRPLRWGSPTNRLSV